MAGKTDIKEIADEFANEYKSLYSSVPSSQSDLIDVQNCINFRIYEQCNKTNCANHFNKLSLEDIDKSIKFLRKNKSDGTDSNLKSDALIKSTPLFRKHMTLLNAMVNHGYTPHF